MSSQSSRVCPPPPPSPLRFPAHQGLDKLENRSLYPEQYANWQNNPAEFTIDGHAPVSRRDGAQWPCSRAVQGCGAGRKLSPGDGGL